MAVRKRRYKRNKRLSRKERSRLLITGAMCTVGAVLLCMDGWIAWVGTVLYLGGIVNWLAGAFCSENKNATDHEEILWALPAFFIWLFFGKIYVSMGAFWLIAALVFSLIASAVPIYADLRRKRRSSSAKQIGRSFLTLLLVFVIIGSPFIGQTNVQLDPFEKRAYEGVVLDIERETSVKSTLKYSAEISFTDSKGQAQEKNIRLRGSEYRFMTVGQRVTVIEGQGLYGIDYWMIDTENGE